MVETMELFGGDFDADPYAVYARLRASRPVCPVVARDGLYAHLITRYDDVRAALADPRLSKDPRHAPADWQAAGRGRPLEDRSGLGAHLLTTDPPDHTRLRRLIAAAFTARRVERLRGRVQEIADTLVDGFAARGTADLIAEFAGPLPVIVICEMLGIPPADRADFRRWTGDVVSSAAGSGPAASSAADSGPAGSGATLSDPAGSGAAGAPDARPAALRSLHEYIVALLAAKRRRPGDDLVSALIATGDADDRLTGGDLVAMIFLLLVAGHETTVNLIGNGLLALLTHPDQMALLREREDLFGAAVEEVLRYDGPVELATWRFATEPMPVAGTVVPAGGPVLLSLAAAGRDPVRFPAPDRFDITRADTRHVGFGHGPHFCVGAPLARIEGWIGLRTLVRRLPGLALAVPPDALVRRRSLTMRGVAGLPVTFAAA